MHPNTAALADVADAYVRGRPEYPAQLCALLGIRPGATVLDLAAGTGKLTRALASSGAEVVAVEPLPRLRERIAGAARVLDGTAEAIPLPDASVDVAAVGDAWHWFDHAAAAGELARVVRPGGLVALLWQVPGSEPSPPWAERFGELLERHRGDHPGFRDEQGRPALTAHPAFEDAFEHHRVPFVHRTDRDGLLAQAASISYVAAMVAVPRAELLRQLGDAVPDGPLEWSYATDVWLARRRRA